MKLETCTAEAREIFVDNGSASVTCYAWSNGEGATVIVNGKGSGLGGAPTLGSMTLTWDGVEALKLALAALNGG